VQRTLYIGVLGAGVVMVLSGLAIWKPAQFQELTWLFGGFDIARVILIRPETLVRWHRTGCRRYWPWNLLRRSQAAFPPQAALSSRTGRSARMPVT